jgi:hypothetical protein
MTKTTLFKTASILLFILAVLFFASVKFYLDWFYWWYDMLLHFLGGVIVGMFSLVIIKKTIDFSTWTNKKVVIRVLFSTLVVGLLWEFLELSVGTTSFSDGMAYVTDTSSDLILDLIGGLVGSLYGIKIWKKD